MIIAGALFGGLPAQAAVIVLDPGHGGENLGAEYLAGTEAGVLEKEMTLELAGLIREALSEQPDIEVYLTREDDRELSLKERAEFAEAVGADLLISLHFNASENHRLYGTEVWISVQKDYYEKTLPAALQFERQLAGMGLHSRGIKTRLGQSRQADYYGILRESVKLGVPAILVEHCHVDNMQDLEYWIQGDSLKRFAQADADAILAYLSEGERIAVPSCYQHWEESQTLRGQDTTPPEEVSAELVERKESSCIFELQAKETESILCYYDYSLDHGSTWSELLAWESGEQLQYPELAIASNQEEIIFRVYNNYDLFYQTAPVALSPYPQQNGQAVWNGEETGKENTESTGIPDPAARKLLKRLLFVIRWVLVAVLCLMILTAVLTAKAYRNNR